MKRLFAILLALGLLRGCAYEPVGGIMDIPINEREPSTSYTIDLSNTGSPNVLSVTVENAVEPYLYNMLEVHVLHTGVVGRFGCPVEVTAEKLENAVLTFEYDPHNMKYVPAENLIGLYYNEEENNYEEIMGTLDETAHTVTFNISREGCYMLVDAYEWYLAWGADITELAHPLKYFFEGGHYPSYYPSFGAVIPEGTTLSFSSDLERTNEENGLITKDYFRSKDGSRLDIAASVIRGEDAWADALAGANYIRSNPVIDGSLLWRSMEAFIVEPKRIILIQHTLLGQPNTSAACFFYVSDKEYVSMTVTISEGDDELKNELVDFVTSMGFNESNSPWYENT